MYQGVNFIYCAEPYNKVLDSIIDPIIKYLPVATKIFDIQEGMLNIGFFVEGPHKSVSFMSHGMGDKGWRDGDRVKDFEYIFVSGPKWKEKLINQGVEEEKILINGFTKLDPIFQSRNKKMNTDGKIHVLYAPTHNLNIENLQSCSSYPRLSRCMELIPSDIDFISSVHPHHSGGAFTMDLFHWADVIISDCSSIIYEAFSLDIPVVFPDWLVKEWILKKDKNTFTEMIYRNQLGYHANSIEELWQLSRIAVEQGIDRVTSDFIEGIFPKALRGNSAQVTAELFLDICNSNR